MVETTRANHAAAWIVDEFEGHKLVSGKLEHREATELRLRYVPEHLIPETRVERERSLQIGDPKAECNVLINGLVVRSSVGQSQAHSPYRGEAQCGGAPVTGECRLSLRRRRDVVSRASQIPRAGLAGPASSLQVGGGWVGR